MRRLSDASPEDQRVRRDDFRAMPSERLDVLGRLRRECERLDGEYLSRWAIELGVDDLLDRAVREAEGREP